MIWKFTLIDVIDTETVVDEPIGWADATLSLHRDPDLHGVFFNYSASVIFYGVAYSMIKTEYDTNGAEGFLRVRIELDCNNSGDFEELISTRINFSKLVFGQHAICQVEVLIEEDTPFTAFNNRKEQQVDLWSTTSFSGGALLPYDPLTQVAIKARGIYKHIESKRIDSVEWKHIGSDSIPSGSSCDLVEEESFFSIGMSDADVQEIQDFLFQPFERVDSVDDVKPILICDDPGTYTFTLQIPIEINLSVDSESNQGCGDCLDTSPEIIQNATVKLCVKIGAVVTEYTLIDGLQCNQFYSNDHTWQETLTADVALGEEVRVYLYIKTWGEWEERLLSSSLIAYEHRPRIHGASIDILALVLDADTQAKVALVNEALSRTAEIITDDQLRVYSDYFGRTDANPYTSAEDGCGSLESVTTGLALRAFNWQPMHTSWKNLYDNLNAIHCLGLGLESDPNRVGYQMLRVERFDYFYSSDILLTCDNIPELKIVMLSNEFFGQIEVGYAKWEAEEYLGLDEFNTKRSYRTSLMMSKNTLTIISNFIASGYAIEVTRGRAFETTAKDDWRYDNSWFIICLKRELGDIVVEQGNIINESNIVHPESAYNYRLSPVRNMLRWMPMIMRSYVDASVGELLFAGGTGNFEAEGTVTDGCVIESGILSESESPIDQSVFVTPTDGDPLFKAEMWEFRYPISLTDYLAIKANPIGIIKVKGGYQDAYTDCYIRHIEYQPAKGEAVFQLLPKYIA